MSEHPAVEHLSCRFSYALRGDGPPVLLIQGAGVHGDGWAPQVDELSRSYRCLTYDNRGMGRSQPLGTRLSVERMADDARVLMDAAGWDSAHVVGHSLGGLIALHLAITNPGRVRSLALLCTGARGRDLVQFSWWTMLIGMRIKIGPRRQRRRAFLEMVMPEGALASADRDALADRLAPIFGYDLAHQPGIAMKQAVAARAYDATPHLAGLGDLPTLVVSGAHDRLAPPRYGRALAAALGNSRYVEFPDAAHGLTVQCAPRLNEILEAHLAHAEARPAIENLAR